MVDLFGLKQNNLGATPPNRAYLASCLWHSVQIHLRWTSDTLGTLDEIFSNNEILYCNFLKMDCEGSEFEIMFNASRSTLSRIFMISMEFHDHLTQFTHKDIQVFLEGCGFGVTVSRLQEPLGILQARLEQ